MSEKPLRDEEIESVPWMKWFRGSKYYIVIFPVHTDRMTETRWTVSKHTYNNKKNLLTKEERDRHVHGGNTAATSAAPSTNAPTNKRKAIEDPEEEGLKEDDDGEQAGRRSKRQRKLPNGPTVRKDVMPVPVASLPAHGHKRKSRDEEEEDMPIEGSNKRVISSGRIVEKRNPRRSL